MDEIDIVLQNARASLGPLCFGSCSAKCCKQGKLLLDKNQKNAFTNNPQIVTRKDGYFELSLEPKGCPNLMKNNKCGIFTDPLRPKICDEYPLFKRGNTIFVASSCTGFTKGLLLPYITKVKELGFQIVVQ